MLYLDSMEQMDDYKVVIHSPVAGIALTGLIDNEEFSYTGSAEMGSSTIAGGVEGFTRGVAKAVVGHVPTAGNMLKNTVSSNMKSAKSTIKGYDGASNTSFNVSMHIFPGKMGNPSSYSEIELQLDKLTQPNINSIGDQLKSYLYKPSDTLAFMHGDDPFKGKLLSLSIGKWFSVNGDLFCSSVPRSYSKWQDTSGKPIYLKADFSFITYRVMSAEDMAGWIKR